MSDVAEKNIKKRKNVGDVGEGKNRKKRKKFSNSSNVEELYSEIEETHFVVEEEPEVIKKLNTKEETEGDTWTSEDYLKLIKRMEAEIPKNDTLSFTSRVERLDWEKIKFGNHTVNECYEKWKVLRSKVRHFRLLGEILKDAKIWAETPWAFPFNKKKNRHPDKPPRPLSSFMLFYMDKKSKIIKRHPELKLTEISRIIGEKYKAMSEEKKAYYLEKAREMQVDYKENLAKFYEKHPELMIIAKKPLNPTNKPLPPYKIYLKQKLQKHQNDENFNQHDFVEKYKKIWKSLSYKKKGYWIRLAKEEEDKYLEHLQEEELEGDGEKPVTTYRSVISKEEQAILDRLAGKPDKPPNSAYSLFSRLMLKDKAKIFVDGEPKNKMKEIASMWKELPEEQKKVYAEKVQHMNEHYKLEMANYLETLPEEKRAEVLAKLQPKKKTSKPIQRKKKVIPSSPASEQDRSHLWKNEPEKPPVTAWDLYKTEFLKKNSHLPSKVAFNQAAAQWKALSKKELNKYKKRHEQLKDKYMVEFEEFLKTLSEEELKEYSTWKKSKSGQYSLNEESLEEESSDEDEEEENSSVPSNSSDESDSGVSEEDA